METSLYRPDQTTRRVITQGGYECFALPDAQASVYAVSQQVETLPSASFAASSTALQYVAGLTHGGCAGVCQGSAPYPRIGYRSE